MVIRSTIDCGVELGQRPDRGQPAKAQHRDPVGHLEDVAQVVRDDEHRDALALQPADEVEHHARSG